MVFRAATIVLALLAGAAAFAQTNNPAVNPTIAVPPAPAIVAAPAGSSAAPASPAPQPPPPGLGQTSVPTAPGTAAALAATFGIAPVMPDTWLPGNTATLGVLDKVDGSTSKISVPVGGQANIGDLQVSVQSCVSRPPDQIPDAAIFLSVQNTAAGANTPLYNGWMVRSTHGATVVGDADETFRVIGCS